jgi:hypothetical protein
MVRFPRFCGSPRRGSHPPTRFQKHTPSSWQAIILLHITSTIPRKRIIKSDVCGKPDQIHHHIASSPGWNRTPSSFTMAAILIDRELIGRGMTNAVILAQRELVARSIDHAVLETIAVGRCFFFLSFFPWQMLTKNAHSRSSAGLCIFGVGGFIYWAHYHN